MATGRIEDLEFMSDMRAAVSRGPRMSANILLFMIVAFFVGAIIWASVAELDVVTRGEGRVIPSTQVQVVQNLEGGIVSAIHVREGDLVEAGQVLLSIDDTLANSRFREDHGRQLVLKAQIARLEAHENGEPPYFPDELMTERPDLVDSELAVYRAEASELQSAVDVLTRQAEQRRQELSELAARLNQLRGSLALGREEEAILEPLVAQGVSARIELIRLQRQINDMSGELAATQESVPRAQSALNEVLQRIDERRAVAMSETVIELARARAELASLTESLTSTEDRVRRTEVRSPVEGTVKQLLINTVGGVVQPGADLVEIVPMDDNLLVEARIRPSDVAFLRPQQEAKVKITAYDFAIYGGLDAQLDQISADTIVDERGESYYEIVVRTQRNFLVDENGEPLPIKPGMIAQVDIMTDKRTVLQYLLKPILRATGNAFTER